MEYEQPVTPLTPLDAQNMAMLNAFQQAQAPLPSAFGNMTVDPRMYAQANSGTPWDILANMGTNMSYKRDVEQANQNKSNYDAAVKQSQLEALKAKEQADFVKRREMAVQISGYADLDPKKQETFRNAVQAGADPYKLLDFFNKGKEIASNKAIALAKAGAGKEEPKPQLTGDNVILKTFDKFYDKTTKKLRPEVAKAFGYAAQAVPVAAYGLAENGQQTVDQLSAFENVKEMLLFNNLTEAKEKAGQSFGSMQVAEWKRFEGLAGQLSRAQSPEYQAEIISQIYDLLAETTARTAADANKGSANTNQVDDPLGLRK